MGGSVIHGCKRALLFCSLGFVSALNACGSSTDSARASSVAGAGGVAQSAGMNSAAGQNPSAGSAQAGGATGGSGGATLAGAGQGNAGTAPVFGLPGASSFARFTVHSYSAIQTGPNGECQTEDPADSRAPYDSHWSFDRASRTFSWDACNAPLKLIEQGSVTLSDSELEGLLALLALVVPSQQNGATCRADGPYAEMDLEVGETSTRYRAAEGWCGAPPSDKNPVDHLIDLWAWGEAKSRSH